MAIIIAGSARLKGASQERALREGTAMAAVSRREPGCRAYAFATDVEDPDVVRIFEEWESADALDAHFQTEHFRAFGSVIAEAVEGPVDLTRYEVASAGPLFG